VKYYFPYARVGVEGAAPTPPYDLTLGGARTLPAWYSDFMWPVAPRITSEVTVSSIADLNANRVAGRRVTLEPGSYTGTISINVDDFDLILTGCTFVGNLEFRSSRVRVTGGTMSTGIVRVDDNGVSRTTDILIDNLHQISPLASNTAYNGGPIGWDRLAIINSTFEFFDYGMLISPRSQTDLIIASCSFVGGTGSNSMIRIQGVIGVMFVDNHLYRDPANSAHLYRMHQGVVNAYVADNMMVGNNMLHNDLASYQGVEMTNVLVENNILFRRNSPFNFFNFGDTTINGVVQNNECYHQLCTASAPNFCGEAPLGQCTGSGNIMKPWSESGYEYPNYPASTVGADH